MQLTRLGFKAIETRTIKDMVANPTLDFSSSFISKVVHDQVRQNRPNLPDELGDQNTLNAHMVGLDS